MSDLTTDFSQEPESVQRAARLGSKSKLPKMPDFSEKMVQPKRANPFILDDWGGSSAANTTKP